jgi:hypothetical protein
MGRIRRIRQDSEQLAREGLAEDLSYIVTRVRRVQTSAADHDGESFGVLIARLAEIQERFDRTIESGRQVLADGFDEDEGPR